MQRLEHYLAIALIWFEVNRVKAPQGRGGGAIVAPPPPPSIIR